ncbi:MAG: aspartate ammonia-lyase [Defluviitaleaceae bacterium]|nr:aspartate ammonia-lyase [Defluviitaleaceae bacterium]
MKTRTERDSIGEKEIPFVAYYGINTARAAENFSITGRPMRPEMIRSITRIKKAAAITNFECGHLEKDKADAIQIACNEILAGRFHGDFIVDPIQGGAGTSFNMNANEVIANRAIELLGGKKGDYDIISPNDHVNYGQSTNDVFPSCGRLATLSLLNHATFQLERLHAAFRDKSHEFDGVIKMGRTQLQDAVPIRLGQEFRAYAAAIKRDLERFEIVKTGMSVLNLGGTAIGTGLNADPVYVKTVVGNLSKVCDIPLTQAEDLIDATQNLDEFVFISGILKACAVSLSKISNDLRLISSGPRAGIGEINLPPRQPGSSIMPGKINPVIPEVVNQVAFNIIGNDIAITMAAEAGQLELNAFEPIIFFKIFESLITLTNAVRTFVDNCVMGITVNEEHCKLAVENSVGIITALNPHIGYEKSAYYAKEAVATGATVRELILRDELLSPAELDKILDPYSMTELREIV